MKVLNLVSCIIILFLGGALVFGFIQIRPALFQGIVIIMLTAIILYLYLIIEKLK
jgi:hypothetical protein